MVQCNICAAGVFVAAVQPNATYCCITFCMGVWEWIAATVQAMRLHLEMKLNRGGTVAAISLSTRYMQSAACFL